MDLINQLFITDQVSMKCHSSLSTDLSLLFRFREMVSAAFILIRLDSKVCFLTGHFLKP